MRRFMTGNEAVVAASVRAGCDFFAGYPITPASSILSGMVRALANGRGKAVQTEDEIAAMGQCIGASMSGARVMTATSGPGLSLYSEHIGLAQMGESPLVIVDCQRMGPATGGATATGEGDVVFAGSVTPGGYPIPVLSATDAETAYRWTYEAFNIAERLRTPVIVLLSKDISLTRQTVDLDSIELAPIIPRRSWRMVDDEETRVVGQNGNQYVPYRVNVSGTPPAFTPIGGAEVTRFTGSIHDERGLITSNQQSIHRKLTHLYDKIALHRNELEYVAEDLDRSASTLIISYGIATGAVRVAMKRLRARGLAVSHLTLYSLWPIPEGAIRKACAPSVQRIIVPELNQGLYAQVLGTVIRHDHIESLIRYDGGLISPAMIEDQVVATYPTSRRVVGCLS